MSGWSWDRVLEKLNFLRWMDFVRTKEEVNKAQILLEREALGPEKLREIGVRVVQQETFFVEPKLEELQKRQTVEA